MNFGLKVWRQKNSKTAGSFADYKADDIPEEASFLEMLDIVNEGLIARNEEPIAFDSDCREGICGMCSLVINGIPHGPGKARTTCQLYMRQFKSGNTIWIEPFRAKAFPVIKDLTVDRSAFDHIIEAGGYISVRAGSAPEGRYQSMTQIFRWRQPLVSAAAAASRLVQTLPPCFLSLPRFHISDSCLKDRRNGISGLSQWFGKWMSSGSGIAETTTNAKRYVRLR
jgi:hypothetical protein